jgi:ribosome-binding ATPase YchF (GTP1/OBG family)
MSFSVGIVGLPNVGKSTLFKLLTKRAVAIAPYPFTTIEPNIGVVKVPDSRLEELAKVVKPEKITPTIIEFVDIAGLIKGAYKGEGLGNQFLSHIRECNAILEVVRCFGPNVNPKADIETIEFELKMKDKEAKKSEDFLSEKPILYLFNIDGKTPYEEPNIPHLTINLKEELEEPKNPSLLDNLIVSCYNILNLITFFTIKGGKEVRAWTLKKGLPCPQAGRIVHSDFKEKFIRAEVINWEKLIESGGWKKAKEKGLIQTVGKDYIVQDGDVIEFKI